MSIMIVIYILNYIDRNNAAAARLRGFEDDLGLKGQEFNTLLSILYVGYIIMQIPSNMLLNYIGRPSIYIPACMVIWGMISVLTGICTNFVGALLARFFLGFVEAAFFPGAIFLLSKWYTREELGLRVCLLYCGNIISNAFGSLLASGVLDGMQGKLGRAAWRWLFFIEGSLSIAIALLSMFILPDFPTTTRWLSPIERQLALRRMERDGDLNVSDQEDPDAHAKQRSGFWQALSDWKVWWLAVALSSEVIALSFNAFFPTLTATLGYNTTVTLILVAPPWFLAAIAAFLVARHSDKVGERFYHIAGPLAVGLIGYIIAMSTMNIAARYVSLFLMALTFSGYVVIMTWVSNSIPRPPAKRAVALAFVSCFSQLGNIAGSYIFPKNWGPTYRKSYAICIATQTVAIAMFWLFSRHLRTLNAALERVEREKGLKRGFRYLL
ncbi:MFS general substrate transporter [Fomitiporia mediterranea MF3/22]|uniref:MFS general substrate transporter n=1 Tax=Fomitiporia mediterranea (strain MF3/22) TaxID=694068 RepID=UPI0004409831|nr:MFS general substrate transporter [Fomitiporia mediterranea MF3/22]EJD01119.1 MFS general substrate transporter [Fomitiporia mediterranea MF3/22]